jgi:hypothetical protein
VVLLHTLELQVSSKHHTHPAQVILSKSHSLLSMAQQRSMAYSNRPSTHMQVVMRLPYHTILPCQGRQPSLRSVGLLKAWRTCNSVQGLPDSQPVLCDLPL